MIHLATEALKSECLLVLLSCWMQGNGEQTKPFAQYLTAHPLVLVRMPLAQLNYHELVALSLRWAQETGKQDGILDDQ